MNAMGGRSRLLRNLSLLLTIGFVLGSAFFSLYSLRANNLRMQELRADIFTSDANGQSREVLESKIKRLRNYIKNHMNTGIQTDADNTETAPIQLAYLYYRDTVAQWEGRIALVEDINPTLPEYFVLAQETCSRIDISERLNCLLEETNDLTAMPDAPNLAVEDYIYTDFVSPSWSWDQAGISILTFGMSVFIFVLRLLF